MDLDDGETSSSCDAIEFFREIILAAMEIIERSGDGILGKLLFRILHLSILSYYFVTFFNVVKSSEFV